MLLERGVAGIVVRLRPARRRHRRPRPLPGAAPPRPADRARQRLRRGRRRARSSATTTSPRWSSPVGHLVELGHTRIGLAVGPAPVHAGAAQDRGLPRGDAPPAGPRGRRAVDRVDAVQRRGRRRRRRAPARARRDRRRLRVRPDGARARCGRCAPAAWRCRGTSRSSATTTRCSIAFTDPPLTTVRQSVQAMGAAAVRALLDEIAGLPAPRAEYVFRPELVVRASTRGRTPRCRRPGRRVTGPDTGTSVQGFTQRDLLGYRREDPTSASGADVRPKS